MKEAVESTAQFKLAARAAGFTHVDRAAVKAFNGGQGTRAPVLHCCAQAFELSMKAELVARGHTVDEVRRGYGHDLEQLWNAPALSLLRSRAAELATGAWSRARASGQWPDDFKLDPVDVLNDYLGELSRLHSAASEYALRYIAAEHERGPVPFLLLDVLEPLIDQQLRAMPGPLADAE